MTGIVNPYALAAAGGSFYPLDLFAGGKGGGLFDCGDGVSPFYGAYPGSTPSVGQTNCAVKNQIVPGDYIGGWGIGGGKFGTDGGYGVLIHGDTGQTGNDTTGSDLQGKAAISACFGMRIDAPGYESAIVCTDGTNHICSVAGASGNNIVVQNRAGDGSPHNLGGSTGVAIHVVGVVDYQAGTWATYINNGLLNSGSFTGGSNSPATDYHIKVWAQNGGWYNKWHYGLIIDKALTAGDMSNLWAWGRARLGL